MAGEGAGGRVIAAAEAEKTGGGKVRDRQRREGGRRGGEVRVGSGSGVKGNRGGGRIVEVKGG